MFSFPFLILHKLKNGATKTFLPPCKTYILQDYVIDDTRHPDGAAHGGTAIIIKSKLKHHELQNSKKKNNLQVTSIFLQELRCSINISAIYSPPKRTVKKQHYEEFFTSLGARFLAGGGYKAKHTLGLKANQA